MRRLAHDGGASTTFEDEIFYSYMATIDYSSTRSISTIRAFTGFTYCETPPMHHAATSLNTYEPHLIEAQAYRVCLDTTSPRFRSRLDPPAFDLNKAPLSDREAFRRSDAAIWKAAMDREVASLMEMGAFEEADLPPGRKAIGLKWVYSIKTDADGVRIAGKEKARLVAQGFSQRPEDYDETYAPVAKMASIRVLLAYAAKNKLFIDQFDCKTAFLHAKNRKMIYGKQIPHYPSQNPSRVLRIVVALYGLRQSAYEFYSLFSEIILNLGFVKCPSDPAVFYGEWSTAPHRSIPMPENGDNLRMHTPAWVDDALAIHNSPALYQWFIVMLRLHLNIVDLGACQRFLSLSIWYDRANGVLVLHGSIYIIDMLDEWHMSNCTPSAVPFFGNLADLEPAPPGSLPEFSDEDLTVNYQRLVGELMYLATTVRPDIAYHAMALARYSSQPTRAHMLQAKRVIRYLAGTKDLGLRFGNPTSSNVPLSLAGYIRCVGCSDSDWASSSDDRKSISGFCFFYEGSLVSWSSVKQKSLAGSSTESEYYALVHAIKEALWLRAFLSFNGLPTPDPFPILSDNQAALSMTKSPAISSRSKHIDIRHHFIRQHVADGTFSTSWIPTADMPADIFTKPLATVLFRRHRDTLGLIPIPKTTP